MSAVAYSYMRFSTPEQRKGDSIRRQSAVRNEFLARNKLTLDTSLSFVDAGVSGHKGLHRSSDKYALGYFLSLVKSGRIKPGSFLIVESLDRLSREDTDEALELLLSLTRSGIRVVQLQPTEIIYQKPVEPMKLMMGIMELSRGNSESRMKSERVGAAWEAKRERARTSKIAITKHCPRWLRKNSDKYEVIPARAETVKRIFSLSAEGHGIIGIIKRLLAENRLPFGRSKHWSNSTIAHILSGRTALGEYQPFKGGKPCGDPIIGFYPAVVSESLYYRSQSGLRERLNHAGGKSKHDLNLFQGLMRHALDDDRIEYRWFTDYKKGKKYGTARYVNSLALIGQAKLRSFPVAAFEKGALSCLAEINPTDIMPQFESQDDVVKDLTAERDAINVQLQKIENALVLGENIDAFVNAAKRINDKKKVVEEKLSTAKIKSSNPQSEAWGTCHNLISALEANPDRETARLRLRSAIRRIIERIDCLFVKNGRRQIACVQFHFAESKEVRTVFVHYRANLTNSLRTTPEHLGFSTMTDGVPNSVKLSNAKHRTLIETVLKKLCEEAAWQRAFEPDRPTSKERIAARKQNLFSNRKATRQKK